jgi:general nucleoside transport system ATP-binding protein
VGIAVSFQGIVKHFGSLAANDSIAFDVQAGTVHALLGENGAGKTTLLSILAGFLRPDRGRILVHDRLLPPGSPRASLEHGIGLCAQHFLLAGALTGAENVLLGRPGCAGLRSLPRERVDRLARLAAANGLKVPLDRPVDLLSVAEQERLEILKLLERDCRVLVLDEPTSVLAPPEVAPLFATLRRLAAEGRTILLVTHRLAEVAQVADRVTVLRRGRVVGEADPREADEATLVRWIAGEEPRGAIARAPAPAGERVLALRDVSCGAGPCAPRNIELDVRAGEIVGIGGVLGNGQSEIVQALTGQIPLRAGRVEILGRSFAGPGRVALPKDVAWIPEDRRAEGLALEMTCAENLRIGLPSGTAPHGNEIPSLLAEFDVRPPDPDLPASHLSGGNQQRLLLAREMSRRARLLLAVHPTRGLDPGATAFVHERLMAARSAGIGILLVTGDLTELQALSDRVAILFRGAVRYAARSEEIDADAMNRALVGVG